MPELRFTDDGRKIYEPDGKVLCDFITDRSHVSVIRGPWGCLSGDTEVLTPAGWVRIDRWSGEPVAEWDQATGEITYRVPVGYVDEPCAEMWHFRNDHSLSMVLSDEHRVPAFDYKGQFVVKSAAELAEKPSRHEIPVSFSVASGGIGLSEPMIRLLVAIAADGHVPERGQQIIIGLRKERKKARLRSLLEANGIAFAENGREARPTETVFSFSREGLSKGLGAEWWSASRSELETLLDEVMLWDGSLSKGEYRFSTTVKSEADIVQFAAHATGRRATISVASGGHETWKPVYCVQVTAPGSRKTAVGLRGDNTQIARVAPVGGRKYCFTTSTGFFIARHDGRIFVTGNSGKTLDVINKIWQIACEQAKSPIDGLRKTRWGAIRNTYGEIVGTTLKDFLDWFPVADYGQIWKSKPIEYHMALGDVRCEVIFMALDTPEDVSKLTSTQFTGFWFHEMQFTDKAIFDDCEGRTGRYPPVRDGGPTWSGILGDMNEPGEEHWLPQMTGEVPFPADMSPDERARMRWPKEWRYFVQPPALTEVFGPDGKTVTGYRVNPLAENLLWLPKGFYAEKCRGKTREWVDSRLMNRISLYVEGRPVWSQFRVETHVAKTDLKPQPGYPILIGLDFGRSPAAVFAQYINNRWIVLDEIVAFGCGAVEFAPLVKRKLDTRFARYEFKLWGDPKGRDKTQTDERTAYDVFASLGMEVTPAPLPSPEKQIQTLIDCVTFVLMGMEGGMPRLLLDPYRPRTLKVAMAGKYHFEKIAGTNEAKEKPAKDRYSHVADALALLLFSGGEGREMTGRARVTSIRPAVAKMARGSVRRVA